MELPFAKFSPNGPLFGDPEPEAFSNSEFIFKLRIDSLSKTFQLKYDLRSPLYFVVRYASNIL